MRKLLLLFTMMMVTGLTYAQLTVPFTENFEGTSGTNLPTGWTEAGTNSGGSSYTWRVQAGLDGKEATVNSPWGGTMNYWLFTSGITLQAEQTYILTFDYRGGDQGNGEKLKVHLGTEATIAGMGTESLFSVESIMHSKFYKTAKVIIKATASGTYYIGFNVENGTGGGTARVGLDNISLKIPLDKDVELTMEEFPPYIFADDVVSVSATLQNIGKEDLTYGLHGQLLVTNVKNGKQVIQKYQQSQPLASGEKDVLNFEEFTLPKGEYTMNVKADWWDDGNTQNNEKEFSFHVFDGQLYHYDNVENGQGQIQDVSYNWTNNPFDIAIKYTVEDLENLGIEEISLVRLWINRIENVNKQSIKIWQGNDGATEVFSQDFTASESRTWLDIILESPYVVDKTQDLYIGVRYDISMYVMPAAFEPDNSYPPTAVDGKSNLIRPVYEAGAGPWENKTGQVGSWKIRMIAGEHIPTYKVTFDIQPDENGDTPEVGNLIFDSEGLGNNTIVEDVEPGTYTYSIYFNGNYHFINDQPVEVIDQDVVVPITPEKWYNILFTVIDEEGIPIQDAEVKINDQIISFNNDMGSYTKYMNDKGDYTYSITKKAISLKKEISVLLMMTTARKLNLKNTIKPYLL